MIKSTVCEMAQIRFYKLEVSGDAEQHILILTAYHL